MGQRLSSSSDETAGGSSRSCSASKYMLLHLRLHAASIVAAYVAVGINAYGRCHVRLAADPARGWYSVNHQAAAAMGLAAADHRGLGTIGTLYCEFVGTTLTEEA
jgi:hypothetical protein